MRKQISWTGLVVAACLAASTAAAQSRAIVSDVQAPAWMERNGERQPLQAGAWLSSGDRLYTGRDARIVLDMPDASTVKLGEQVKFEIRELQPAHADQPFRGLLRVLTGAFRYTTTPAGGSRARQLDIQVGTATIGIRGTDVWGKAGPKQDLVCLLEGRIEISREGETPVAMHEPLSVYTASPGKPAGSLSKAEAETVQTLALQTELAPGQGVMRRGGAYGVYLYMERTETKARRRMERLSKDGYAAEISQARADGETRYRVVIPHFASLKDAAAAGAKLAKRYRLRKNEVYVGET
jgi:hypothetical protein